jgi:hypothetical protein
VASTISTAFCLPSFDTGLYEGFEFLMSQGNATLTICVTERPPIAVKFERVRWHEFVALYNCSAEQVSSAYFKLVEVVDSTRLIEYVQNDQAGSRAYQELHHYRIFLDESGCHELFAQSWSHL